MVEKGGRVPPAACLVLPSLLLFAAKLLEPGLHVVNNRHLSFYLGKLLAVYEVMCVVLAD